MQLKLTRRLIAALALGTSLSAHAAPEVKVTAALGCPVLRAVKILALLHAQAGKAIDRNTCFSECWGLEHMPNSRTLDQQIAQLRKRIERDPKTPAIIQTVHGVGYRYDA